MPVELAYSSALTAKGSPKQLGKPGGAYLTSTDASNTGGKKASTASVERSPQDKSVSINPEPATKPSNAGLKPTSQYEYTPTARPPKIHTTGTKTQYATSLKQITNKKRRSSTLNAHAILLKTIQTNTGSKSIGYSFTSARSTNKKEGIYSQRSFNIVPKIQIP